MTEEGRYIVRTSEIDKFAHIFIASLPLLIRLMHSSKE